MGSSHPVFPFLLVPSSLDGQFQINLECLLLHKSAAPSPAPSSIPIETVNPEQLTSSSPLAPDGIETFSELNYQPEYAMSCSAIAAHARYSEPPGYYRGVSPQPPGRPIH